jgi:hypothetical protein
MSVISVFGTQDEVEVNYRPRKIMIYFAKFLGSKTSLYEIHKREQVLAFLDTRIKERLEHGMTICNE